MMKSPILLASLLALPLAACSGTHGQNDDDDTSPVGKEVPVGVLVITEIHAYSNTGRPEWIEVFNASDDTHDLLGCQLVDGGSSEHEFVVASSVPLAPGEYALLASDPELGLVEGELPADVVWGDDISLNQADPTESVRLLCPDGIGARQLIDEVAFDWNGSSLHRGRSLQLAVDADAVANDDLANWCEAPVQDNTTYAELDGLRDLGTPRGDTICETPGGPTPSAAGQLVITELLAGEPHGVREWFELYNPGAEALDIRRCVLGDLAVGSDSDPNTHTLDYELGDTVVPAGGYLLLSKGGLDITPDGAVMADYPYSSLTFNNSDNQSLWLDCPDGAGGLVRIDEIIYNWSPYASFRGGSLQVDPSSLDAEANDDPDSWCLGDADLSTYYSATVGDPPEEVAAWGTPGQPNTSCPVPGPPPAPGEVIFTEILVHDFTGVREWFELTNTTGDEIELLGCRLQDAPAADPTDLNTHVIEFTRGQTAIAGGDTLLLAKSGLDVVPDGSVMADYEYNGMTFNNSDEQLLWLECDGDAGVVVVDELSYDWDTYGSDFQGRSLARSSADDSWCLSDESAVYYSDANGTAIGTPDAPNGACPIPDPFPTPGEIVITEIMVHSHAALGTTEEWFEVKNVSAGPVSLDGCVIYDDDGDGSPAEHTIAAADGYSVAAGAYSVLVKSSAADSLACALPHDYVYSSSISFLNASPETLSVRCPDGAGGLQVIDAVAYDGGFEPGLPWQLRGGSETATANDDAANWCVQTDTSAYSWECTVGAGTNYGTPGAPSACP